MRKSTKIISVLLALSLLSSTSLFAKEIDDVSEFNSSIGVYTLAGVSAGIGLWGLQYQHWFNNRIGAAFDFSALYNSDLTDAPQNKMFVNFNAEFDYALYRFELSNDVASQLYLWALGGVEFKDKLVYEYTSEGYQEINTDSVLVNAVVGLGFAFDFTFYKHISVPVQIGFLGTFPNDTCFDFCLGTGLRYSF